MNENTVTGGWIGGVAREWPRGRCHMILLLRKGIVSLVKRLHLILVELS